MTTDYKNRILGLEEKFTHTSLLVNKGMRRLITAQSNELLEEVAQSFRELGFSVTLMDEELDDDVPKREDLRLGDPDIKDWEAIVEVRGHAKSSGQASNLNRLPGRFAKLYRAEKGKDPDKLIYVVNGQIETFSPQLRNEPFSAAPDAVEMLPKLMD